jgi:hypothetical protein
MFPLKSIALRFALFCGLYLCLAGIFSIPAVHRSATVLYGKSATFFLRKVLPKAAIETDTGQPGDQRTLRVLHGDKKQIQQYAQEAQRRGLKNMTIPFAEFNILIGEFFWYPFAFFLALVGVSPLSWQVKARSIGIGLLFFLFFTWLKLLCYTLYYMSSLPQSPYILTGNGLDLVTTVFVHLKTGISFLVATLIWIGVVFNSADWRSVVGRYFSKP